MSLLFRLHVANGCHFRSVFFNAAPRDKRYESRNRNRRRLIVSFEIVVDFVAERHATDDNETVSRSIRFA